MYEAYLRHVLRISHTFCFLFSVLEKGPTVLLRGENVTLEYMIFIFLGNLFVWDLFCVSAVYIVVLFFALG